MTSTTLNTSRKKIPAGMKAGYSIGQMADSIGFNVFYFFFLFFLTNFAGVSPGIAGTISLIAVVWDAITDPIIGNISDNLKSKSGRRRPVMLASLIPYSLCVFLLFTNIDVSADAKYIYYIIVSILFWTSYTAYVIPYFALGGELTDDFNERTNLRSWASVFMQGAVTIASAGPPFILAQTAAAGGSGLDGWRNVGIIFALITALTIFICWKTTKGGELVTRGEYNVEENKQEGNPVANLFKNFGAILKLKPTKYLALSVFGWALVTSLNSSGLVYVMTSIMGLKEGTQSIMFVILTACGILWLPVINMAAAKTDKQKVFFLFMLISGIGLLLFRFIGFGAIPILIIFMAVFAFGNSTFWTLYYSMMYDISELDEFINNKRREGVVAAFMSFTQKLGAAVAMWMTGFLLEIGGYDGSAAVQSEEAINAIMNAVCTIPGIIGILAAVFAFFYPLTKPRFTALTKAIALKKEGKEYSTEGFEKLL